MPLAVITDHTFPSLQLQQDVLHAAGCDLREVRPLCRTEDDVIEYARDADVLLVQWAPVSRRVLEALPNLKGIVRYGIGVNNFDLAAAKDLGVAAANVPSYCLEEVSNHAMAMLLSLARRIPQDHAGIVQGRWGVDPYLPMPAILDLTLGLVGFGAIGRRVARKARVFGFRVIAYDPFAPDSVFAAEKVERVELEDLLERSGAISLHCPLVEATRHLIDARALARTGRGTIVVNTSRGPLIEEKALVAALRSGQLSGAGLDVFEEEPLPPASELRSLGNVVLTSHAASVSLRAGVALQVQAAEAARDILLGIRPEGALVWPDRPRSNNMRQAAQEVPR